MAVRSLPRREFTRRLSASSMSPRTRQPSVLAKTPGAIEKTPDDFTYLKPSEFPTLFAPDLPRVTKPGLKSRSQVLAAAQVFNTPLTAAAWKTKPSWGIIAGDDQIINPGSRALVLPRAKKFI